MLRKQHRDLTSERLERSKMRYKISSIDYLISAIGDLSDSLELPWHTYPCLLWERGKLRSGHGSLIYNGRIVCAHQISFELTYGPLSIGSRVWRRCPEPSCFRPSHLFAQNNHEYFKQNLANSGYVHSEVSHWSNYPCLLWDRGTNGAGYGLVVVDGLEHLTHRLAHSLYSGELLPGMDVCHHCDVRSCYSPAHLFQGTRLDNVRDMISKGRQARQPGELASRAKLTEQEVLEIRRLHMAGSTKIQRLARTYCVANKTIRCIINRQSWTHI